METAKRARKANWTEPEVDELRDSYLELRSVVDGRLGVSLTNSDKERAWKTITERVNSQGLEFRTMDEVKKKLSDLKTAVKKRERERRQLSQQTGGGPAPGTSRMDEKMIEAIGEVAVGGFKGIDTFSKMLPTCSTSTVLPTCSTSTVLPTCSTSTELQSLPAQQVKDVFTARPVTPVTVSEPFGKNKKRKAEVDDDTKTVISLLQEILEEQRRTNQILSQLFAINVEQ